jgi:manganese/iron transport system permease protein/iron/zinc/copper transport system permease protein
MLIYACLIGAATGVTGMYLSYIFNAASGATIVLFGALLFCLAGLAKLVRQKFALSVTLHRHGDLVHSHPHTEAHIRPPEKDEKMGEKEEFTTGKSVEPTQKPV